MSKIGKKNIVIPKESSIKIEGSNLIISGPKGTKTLTINDKIFSSKLDESKFQIEPLQKKIDKKTSIMWGTYRSLINNAVDGVSKGHCIKVTDAPDNIAEWRMKYNFGTSSVDVYAGVDKTDDEAVQAQLDANAAEATEIAEKEAARIAALAG